ncbi:hypothetical protein [Streptomyces cyaneofuscatus]|uniref:hypothetical protein n=1 Tax=Streptomyces cyaneofuscatus TaxID=66883 RepID=UPI003412776F
MSAEIVQFLEQAGPYLTAALSAYGAGVLTRTETAAVDATANVGRRILQAVWRRRDEQGRAELESVVGEAAEEPGDEDVFASLRYQIKKALREEASFVRELNALLPERPNVSITATGERSIAAEKIHIAITGDSATIRQS